MVTAETALALPAVMITLGLALGVGATAIDQVRCVDAARAGARAAARGDGSAAVRSLAQRGAPTGARVEVTTGGDSWVTVTVTGRPPAAVGWIPGWPTPAGRATSPTEAGQP